MILCSYTKNVIGHVEKRQIFYWNAMLGMSVICFVFEMATSISDRTVTPPLVVLLTLSPLSHQLFFFAPIPFRYTCR